MNDYWEYEYQVLGYYSSATGWEVLTAEETRSEAKDRLREYDEHEPMYPHRIRKVRA